MEKIWKTDKVGLNTAKTANLDQTWGQIWGSKMDYKASILQKNDFKMPFHIFSLFCEDLGSKK